MAASNSKVKGLLKGLRYISQIFETEKEQEMQIGNPTDVKHVAHIGWDGPSVNSPSWMNEFKSATGPGPGAPPLDVNGDLHTNRELDSPARLTSQDSRGRTSRSVNSSERGSPDIPKSSRRQPSSEFMDSPSREKSEKPRQRRTSKLKESSDGSESPARNLPDKKSRKKKSKETSRLKAQNSDLALGSPSGSVTKSRNKHKSFDEDSEGEKG